MAEAYGKYKKYGGINNFSKKNTILVDNLVTNSLYTNVIPRGLSEEAMLWIYDAQSNFEVYTRKKYTINQTHIDSSIGDLAGNAVNISGLTINSDTVNLWPINTNAAENARFGGNYIENRNLQLTEISGGLVHGEVNENSIRAHTYAHVHGTMNLVSGEFAHVHGLGNRVMIEGVGAHVEGSGNSCDISYAHILGRDNDISAVFMNGEKDIIRVASKSQRMSKMFFPDFNSSRYLSLLYHDYQFSGSNHTFCFWIYFMKKNCGGYILGNFQGGNGQFIQMQAINRDGTYLYNYPGSVEIKTLLSYYTNQAQTTSGYGQYNMVLAKGMWHHLCITTKKDDNQEIVVSYYRNGEHITETNRNTTGPFRTLKAHGGFHGVGNYPTWTSPVGPDQNNETTLARYTAAANLPVQYVEGDGKWGMIHYTGVNFGHEFCIGKYSGYPNLSGPALNNGVKLLDFRYFNRAITQSEVRQIYNTNIALSDEVVHLPFDRPDPTYNLGSFSTVLGKKVRNNGGLVCRPTDVVSTTDVSVLNDEILIPQNKKAADLNDGTGYGSLLEGHTIMLGVSSEYVYGLGYTDNIDSSGGYISGVGSTHMGIGGYIDASYSIVTGLNNIVSAGHSFVGGISNEILYGGDSAFVYGTEIVCSSGNSNVAMLGKYNEINNAEIDFEGGERMLFSVGNGESAIEDISFSTFWDVDKGNYVGTFPDLNRCDIFYVTNKSVGMQKLRTTADLSINSVVLTDSKTSDRYLSFKDGVITIFDNWDVDDFAIDASGTITAANFYGDGKYLTGGSDDRGWRIFENPAGANIDEYDYYVSALDVSFVKVVNTAFKRDIDIAQLCDIRLASGTTGSWDDDISGSAYRNSEYVFTDAQNGDGPVKYALDKYDSNETTVGRYYGKGMMTRMTFVPHRKSSVADVKVDVCEVGSSGATSLVSGGGISVISSETSGNILDIVYSGAGDIISYQKPIQKALDDVFTPDKSSTTSNLFTLYRGVESIKTIKFDNKVSYLDINLGVTAGWDKLISATYTKSFWFYAHTDGIETSPHVTVHTTNGLIFRQFPGSPTWRPKQFYFTPTGAGVNSQSLNPNARESMTGKENQWMHFTTSYDGTTNNDAVKLYINGTYTGEQNWTNYTPPPPHTMYDNQGSGPLPLGTTYSSPNFRIGNVWSTTGANYSLQDFRHFDRVLSASEISSIYRGTNIGDEVLQMRIVNPNYAVLSGSITQYNPTVREIYDSNPGANQFPTTNLPLQSINPAFITTYAFTGANTMFNYFPAIDPLINQLYIGADDGKLHAFSINNLNADLNNSRLWSFDTSQYSDDNSVRGIAIGAANRIYMTVTNPIAKWGALYAIDNNSDRTAGVEAWKYEIQSIATKYQIETMPTVDVANNEIYFGDDEGNVHCVEDAGSSFNVKWVIDLSAQIATTGALDSNGILYVVQSVPAPSSLFAINTRGNNAGTVRWKYQTVLGEAGLSYSSPALDTHDNVYIMTGSDNTSDPSYCHIFKICDVDGDPSLNLHGRLGPFHIHEKTSSYINSSSNTYYLPKDFITSPVIDNDGSIFFTHGYEVVKLNSDLQTQEWKYNMVTDSVTDFPLGVSDISVCYIPSSPIVSLDGLVYVSAQNTLFGFNAVNGAVDISYTMIGGGITRSSPVMLNSRGQWGMHGFDCTRRGKRYPII